MFMLVFLYEEVVIFVFCACHNALYAFGHDGRAEVSVAEQAVCGNYVSIHGNARQIIRVGGADACVELQDARVGEAWVEAVEGAHEL